MPGTGDAVLISIICLKSADGSERYVLEGVGISTITYYSSYDEALRALKRIKALRDDYERLKMTRDISVFNEEADAAPDRYKLYVLKIEDKVFSAIVTGPFAYFEKSRDRRELLRTVWDKSTKPAPTNSTTPKLR